ncbi:MAG: hypothetical protein JWN86_1683 [Planctomycetota bacterium]|nr:hypothetical protein [Planctomycetota bacterium]
MVDEIYDRCGAEGIPPGLRGARMLRAKGLTSVPLRPAGQNYWRGGEAMIATGKEPRNDEFAARALRASDEDDDRMWLEHPDAGVAVLLGLMPWDHTHRDGWSQAEGIVDIEEDDPEAAQATWARIFPDGVPKTLSFRSSGTGGMHRFYRIAPEVQSEFCPAGISASVIQRDPGYPGLEFRLGSSSPIKIVACQSVCPPTATLHTDVTLGPSRAWIDAPIAPFPEALLDDLITHSAAARKFRARQEAEDRRVALRNEPVPRGELVGLSHVETFVAALERVGHPYKDMGADCYSCSCTAPGHPDSEPSMSFKRRDNGDLRVTCHSRDCTLREIMEGIGLRGSDTFGRGRIMHRPIPVGQFADDDWSKTKTIDLIQDEEAGAWEEEQDEYFVALAREPELRRLLTETLQLPERALEAIQLGDRARNCVKGADGAGKTWAGPGPSRSCRRHSAPVRRPRRGRRQEETDRHAQGPPDQEDYPPRRARSGHPIRLCGEAGADLGRGGGVGRAGPDLRRQGRGGAAGLQGRVARGRTPAERRSPRDRRPR